MAAFKIFDFCGAECVRAGGGGRRFSAGGGSTFLKKSRAARQAFPTLADNGRGNYYWRVAIYIYIYIYMYIYILLIKTKNVTILPQDLGSYVLSHLNN